MNIYKLTNNPRFDSDTYESCIVVAQNERLAKTICPDGTHEWNGSEWMFLCDDGIKSVTTRTDWCTPLQVECEFIATLPENSQYCDGDVILVSWNAGLGV